MALPKFEKQYMQMIEINKALFEELRLKSKKRKGEEFAEVQRRAIRVVRRNEDALCSKTENTYFSNFSTNLADKFWDKVRADFPEIDYTV